MSTNPLNRHIDDLIRESNRKVVMTRAKFATWLLIIALVGTVAGCWLNLVLTPFTP